MLKLGQSQVKRDELVTRMETLALPLVSLGGVKLTDPAAATVNTVGRAHMEAL